jgi:hypothetical protein
MPRRRKPKRVKRRHEERLRDYSTDYPIHARGHAYNLRGVPADVWDRAVERALVERRSLRWILITLLKDYAEGSPMPWTPPIPPPSSRPRA